MSYQPRRGKSNVNDALRECIGRTVVSLRLSDDAKSRTFVFDDGSEFTFTTQGPFWWKGPESPAASQQEQETS